MTALITGASSGLGRDMALYLSFLGYDLILAARRRRERLEESVSTNTRIMVLDLSVEENCYALYEQVKATNIDILINNAGYGLFGEFVDTPIKEDVGMMKIAKILTSILPNIFLFKNYICT